MPRAKAQDTRNCYERPDGRFQVRLTVTDPRTGLRRRVARYAPTLKAAQQLRDKMRGQEAVGQFRASPERRTVRAWLEEWHRDVVTPHTRPNTVRAHSVALGAILPVLGDYRLTALTPVHVQRWVAGLEARGLKPGTVRQYYAVLRAGLEHAVDMLVLERNPTRRVKLPPPDHAPQPVLTIDQARALLAQAKDTPLEAMVALGVGLGLRKGEMLGLRWQDIDFERGLLSVRVQSTADKGTPTGQPVKSRGSVAVLPLPPPIAAILTAHRARMRQVVIGPLVFCRADGKPISHRGFDYQWQKLQRSADITPAGYHACRRAQASILVAAGTDPATLKALLRHTSAAVTLTHYARTSPEQLRAAGETMGKVLEG